MSDFIKACKDVKEQIRLKEIQSYFIELDFGLTQSMIEVVDLNGTTRWQYFDKRTGQKQ